MGTESLQTYNKIEPSSCSIKDRIIQIIGFSALLLWLAVYAIQTINFNEYEDGSLLNDDSLIKALLFLAMFSFALSILLGTWIYYKIKRAYSKDPSNWIIKLIKWFTLGLLVFMLSILYTLVPESNRFFTIYLIALTFAVKYVRDEMLKKWKTEHERTYM
ncbi:hypothetical protein [Methanosarcina sp. 1.H.A.2.2]|uniref:hypothetical protein n=1 Tax=Methanosarcina sp. 1.H.A.2.2 TaxID=1483601 RepID=UPI000621880B|nr:hypothetical protein [Methanosarcina sp. 1.H.A.2.2]KKH49240.1 hypothetical protein EO93_13990 [Methanosarcina sp. 1.H.A.2.2]